MRFSSTINKKWLNRWLIIFLIFTVLALMNFARFVTNELAEGNPGKYQFYFIMEMTGAYTLFLLLPFFLLFFKRFPISKQNLYFRIPLYLLAYVFFGASHTLLMYLSRIVIFWLADLGPYNYGHLGYRFFMEYTHQFLTFWIIFGITLFFKYIRENQDQKLKASHLQQQLTTAQLQALHMQLNPHFLFNTLNMISSTVYKNPVAADKMIANLSELLRISLNKASWKEHPLEKELELVSLYTDIMKARFEDKLVVKMEIADQTRKALVPGFILQPLVENAIRYSMENLETVEIEISSKKNNDQMILSIKDNGPGFTNETDRHGVGLSNTKERLEKMYGPGHRFQLRNLDDGGFQVEIEIPLREALN